MNIDRASASAPRPKEGRVKEIRLDQIPEISGRGINPGDLYVNEVEITNSGADPMEWWAIIYRPSIQAVYKVRCWDGTNSSYHPELPGGNLPDTIKILKD